MKVIAHLTLISLFFHVHAGAQNTDSSGFYFNKGMEFKNKREYLSASMNFSKAIAFNPKNTQAYVENGFVEVEMHKTDLAITQFKKSLELDPTNQQVLMQLSQLYYNFHQYLQAMQTASKCPPCDEKTRIIGFSNFYLGNYVNAVKVLPALGDKNTTDAEIFYILGKSYSKLEQDKVALGYYNKTIAIDPSKYQWSYEFAFNCYQVNDYENAAKFFTLSKDHGYPVNNDFKEAMGLCLIHTADNTHGEQILSEVMESKGNASSLLWEIAQVYYDENKSERAAFFYHKLVELDPKNSEALYQEGMSYLQMGEKAHGQELCDKAIKMDFRLASHRRQTKENVGL